MATTPTMNRRQLGALLKRFRMQKGMSQQELGMLVFPRSSARTAQSTLAAIESGQRSLHPADLSSLQQRLGIDDPDVIADMARMLEQSSQRGRWGGYRAVFEEGFRRWVDLEEEADRIRTVSVGLHPDLAMCEAYVREIFRGKTRDDDVYEASVAARMSRTKLLDQTDSERIFHFILDESCLHKAPRGNRVVLREQISHMIDLSRRENIRVQIVPFAPNSPHAEEAMLYPFTSVRVPSQGLESSLEFVFVGVAGDYRYIDAKPVVEIYDRRFSHATEAGLYGDAARRFMQDRCNELL